MDQRTMRPKPIYTSNQNVYLKLGQCMMNMNCSSDIGLGRKNMRVYTSEKYPGF